MSGPGWHVPGEDLRRYAERVLAPPGLWSTEAHLTACLACRQRLGDLMGPAAASAGWARLDAELDAPTPDPVERLLLRLGTADHTARLLVATPALRLSWLAAVASTLALTIALAHLAHPLLFLAVAPLLPLIGVAASYGPGVDPTYEVTVVAPINAFRLLLLRTVTVLVTTTGLSTLASLGLPGYGIEALGWFLPALALTLLSVALAPRLGHVGSAATVGLGWAVLLASTLGVRSAGSGRTGSVLFAPGGQLAVALAAMVAAVVLSRLRPTFDTPRRFDRTPRFGLRRLS